jgi:methylated-DNA-[protein]-cysteine S-methyltransferase
MTISTYTMTMTTQVGRLVLESSETELVAILLPTSGRSIIGQSHERPAVLSETAIQLEEYFARKRTDFQLPMRLGGTKFQQEVWGRLLRIPYGETLSYGELARDLGRPKGYRAVGQANARNPIPIVVPCHRLVASDGLGGYAGGLAMKQELLRIEGIEPWSLGSTEF